MKVWVVVTLEFWENALEKIDGVFLSREQATTYMQTHDPDKYCVFELIESEINEVYGTDSEGKGTAFSQGQGRKAKV